MITSRNKCVIPRQGLPLDEDDFFTSMSEANFLHADLAISIEVWVVHSNLNLHDALISLQVDKARPIGAPEWWSDAKAELARLEGLETDQKNEYEQYKEEQSSDPDDRTATTGLSPPDWERM